MASSKDDLADRNTFRFEDLPAELQVRIIELNVIQKKPIEATFLLYPHRRLSAQGQQPEISKVNKQIRVEALKAYYRDNEFHARYHYSMNFENLMRWLEACGPENRELMKKLKIGEHNPSRRSKARCLRWLLGDKQLRDMGAKFMVPKDDYGLINLSFHIEKR